MGERAIGPTCDKHDGEPAAGRCSDCGVLLCTRCRIEVPGAGPLCWACAALRGGLRARRKLRAVPLPPEPPARPDRLAVAEPFEDVVRFEERVADRAPRPLISGLRERLEQAGIDPAAALDEAGVQAGIDHLQAAANEGHGAHRHRGRRRR